MIVIKATLLLLQNEVARAALGVMCLGTAPFGVSPASSVQ